MIWLMLYLAIGLIIAMLIIRFEYDPRANTGIDPLIAFMIYVFCLGFWPFGIFALLIYIVVCVFNKIATVGIKK